MAEDGSRAGNDLQTGSDLLGQLTGFLSSEDGMKQLQSAARMLGLGGQQDRSARPVLPQGTGHDDPFGGADPQLMMKMVRLMQNARQETPSSAFLRALKPLLKEERQAKVDDAIRMLQLFSLLPLLKEMG